MSTPLAGKIALVTGAEQAISRGVALALGAHGAAVALIGDARSLAPVVADLEASGARSVAVSSELESRDATDRVFAEAGHALEGSLDIVVHAAVAPIAFEAIDFAEVDGARWDAVWETSMRTTIFVLQAAFGQMEARGGRVLLVTPTVSMSGAARLVPYTAVLEAQRVLAKSAARQWGATGITVNCLAPAPEHAPIGIESMTVSLAPPALGGPGDVQHDIGPVAVFLASDAGHFVTGATLNTDGGVWMAP